MNIEVNVYMAASKQKTEVGQDLNLENVWEGCIYDLFNPKNHLLGEVFFESALILLGRCLNADFVYLTKKNKELEELETVAQYHRDIIINSNPFDYKQTPCNEVLKQNSIVTIKDDFCKQFPNAENLRTLNIRAYCGVPIYNSSLEPVGVLTAFFQDKIIEKRKIEALMFMFSSRISSELEHLEKQRELKRRNLELLVFKEELIRKNRELDKANQDLKKASKKAEESNKLKSSFLANLSHEIRTPMNAIIGFTELLKSNNLNQKEKIEYLNIIHQNGNQLMRVMDALIDISKLQTKVYVEPKERIKVNELLSEICTNYSKELKAIHKPVKINLLLGYNKGRHVLNTHKEALHKIFDHLISNSIKFTKQGEIYIGYTIENNYFNFFVKDTGIGIPKGHEESIFDLFRQADLNNSREFGGNGIGLAIVKRYVEIMGGDVWAEPNQKVGALIKFKVPI